MAITVVLVRDKYKLSFLSDAGSKGFWSKAEIDDFNASDYFKVSRIRGVDYLLTPTRKNLNKSQKLLHKGKGYSKSVLTAPKRQVPELSFWLINKEVYLVNDKDVTLEDVLALLGVKANQRKIQLEKAHALQAMASNMESKPRRQSIPQAVRIEVWQRDCGRCVECESQEKLEFDHVIPVSMGGSNTARNIQLLCELCNRTKGASLG